MTASQGPLARSAWREVLDRIGGPNSVTWPGFVLATVLGTLAFVATSGPAAVVAQPLALVPTLAGAVGSYALLAGARLTVLRPARVQPIPIRTLLSFVLSAIFGGIVSSAIAAGVGLQYGSSGPVNPVTAILAIVASIVTETVMLSLVAVAIDAWREYRDGEAELAQLETHLKALQEAAERDFEAHEQQARQALSAVILERFEHAGADEPAVLSRELRSLIEEVVRPLSRELVTPPVSEPVMIHERPSLNIADALADAVRSPLVYPWLWGLLVWIPTFFTISLTFSVGVGLMISSVWLVEITIVGLVANFLYRRVRQRMSSRVSGVYLLGVIGFATVTAAATAMAVLPGDSDRAQLLLFVLMIPIVAALLTAAKITRAVSVSQQADKARLDAEISWQSARTRGAEWAGRNALVRALHGPIQSSLVSAALKLDQLAATDASTQDLHLMREQLRQSLSELLVDPDIAVDLDVTLARVHAMWSSVCEVSIDVDREVLLRVNDDPVCSRIAADVVTEACSNAIRHGNASRIQLSFAIDERILSITAAAFGSTATSDSVPGVGTELLDRVCLRWSREIDESGSRLVLQLPVR